MPCYSRYMESLNRTAIQTSPGINMRPHLKNNKSRKGLGHG
jgi:hypothetical protein